MSDAILHRRPPAPSAIRPELPGDLDRIVSTCLEKDPDLRYQSAADLGADLARLRRTVAARSSFAALRAHRDPEPKCFEAILLSQCGLTDMAYELIRSSLGSDYCPYPDMLELEELARLREGPRFAELRAMGEECHARARKMLREHPLPGRATTPQV